MRKSRVLRINKGVFCETQGALIRSTTIFASFNYGESVAFYA